MFFDGDDDDEPIVNPVRYQIVSRQLSLYAVGSHLESDPFSLDLRSVPTHTEDGIPIRKLYVANLPPKTTRTELFSVFAAYGFIKSCWLRMGEKGPNKSLTPTYAFVTYSNPADAHKALRAPYHEKTLRGRTLRISPADSWHQPAQGADGRVHWKPRSLRCGDGSAAPGPSAAPDTSAAPPTSAAPALECGTGSTESAPDRDNITTETSNREPASPDELADTPKTDEPFNILDILNVDCLTHILNYVPITNIIQSERVSKRWQSMVQEYLQGMRTFKTSWWAAAPDTLTTAVLRRVLQRVGASLVRLHIDHPWSALNDRTAHTIGKFCPNLEELQVLGMDTKNWNPLIYGCIKLRSLAFIECDKLTDSSLIQIVKHGSRIESLTVSTNTNVTGLFLTGSNPPRLSSLAFHNCYSLQGTVLCAAIDSLPHLTALKLDLCAVSVWKIVPLILAKLPRLAELSLSDYTNVEYGAPYNEDFCDGLANLTELKVLNLSNNIYVTNAVLKRMARSCTELESLNVSHCNSRKFYPGVSDEGVMAVCAACRALSHLDVSSLTALTDAGLRAAAGLPRLARLVARGNPALSAAPFAAAIAACHALREVDACGCDGVSEEAAAAAALALATRPRRLLLRLAGTAAAHAEEMPTHNLLTVNIDEDLSVYVIPNFVDNTFEISSEDSYDGLYDPEDFDEFFGPGGGNPFYPNSDDDPMDENMYDYEMYHYGLRHDVILI